MCPVCIAAAALIAAKIAGGGGAAALAAGKFLKRTTRTTISKSTGEKEVHDGYHDDGVEAN
jgi:hypothetical protein